MSAGQVSSHAAKAIHAMASGKWKECEAHLDAIAAWVDSRRRMVVSLKGEEGGTVKAPSAPGMCFHAVFGRGTCTLPHGHNTDHVFDGEVKAPTASVHLDVKGFHTSSNHADYAERPTPVCFSGGAPFTFKAPDPVPELATKVTQFRASGGGVETRQARSHLAECVLEKDHPEGCVVPVRFTSAGAVTFGMKAGEYHRDGCNLLDPHSAPMGCLRLYAKGEAVAPSVSGPPIAREEYAAIRNEALEEAARLCDNEVKNATKAADECSRDARTIKHWDTRPGQARDLAKALEDLKAKEAK